MPDAFDYIVIATPVVRRDLLLCMTGWGRGAKMLKLDPAKPGASVLWEARSNPHASMSSPLFLSDQHFYLINTYGELGCFDAASGKELWTSQEPTSNSPLGNAHLTPNGDRVFLFNHRGHLILARLTPQGYQEIGRSLLVEPTAGTRAQGYVTWSHPAYANKHVFARTVASASWDRTVRLWDATTGQERGILKGHDEEILTVAFSPDPRAPALATGSADWTVRLWDLATKRERAVLKGHRGAIYCVAFSSDGKTLATGSGDETVKLWDVVTATERATLRVHRSGISAIAFTPDCRTLATAGMDDAVRLWELSRDK